MKVQNTNGTILYGLHFYPGVAEYTDPGTEPYRVFLNEATLRTMDPTFTGKPIFVEHVDEVNPSLDNLRKEADGWVVESFFNAADGKHWVKFIIVSERGERAIRNGLRLSNAYLIKDYKQGGLWNGVSYLKEIVDAEYEHLAIVKHPRYEESVIMTPDEFKNYNEQKVLELKKISNSKGDVKMKLNFFKRAKVENAIDPDLSVVLPKSGKEITLTELVTNADEKEMKKDMNSGLADMEHKVKMHDGSYCNVGELLEKHKAMNDELEEMKKKKEDAVVSEEDMEVEKTPVDSESVKDKKNDDDDSMDNADEDEVAKKKALELAAHEEKEIEAAKKKNAAAKAARLKNAPDLINAIEPEYLDLSYDKLARGKERY